MFSSVYVPSLLILSGALLLLGFGSCGKEEGVATAPLEVKVLEAVQKDVPITLEWVGQTFGAVDIEIRARTSGWLLGIHFQEGTIVKKGSLLYTIDPSELKQQVAEAQAKLSEAQVLLARAESDVKRYRPLAASGAVSQRDLEAAEAEYGARQGEVDATKASLQLSQIELSYATILAPITGLIGISQARVGDYVGKYPNPVILNTISRVDSIHVRFSITEKEYLDLTRRRAAGGRPVPAGQQQGLTMELADGSVYPYKGSLIFAQRQIDAATGTLQFEATFPNPNIRMRPGQFARIRGVVDERKAAIVIPTRSLIDLQGQFLVYVVGAENKAEMRKVKLGPKSGSFTVIEEGVKPGDKVIVEGIQRVRPDMPLNPSPFTVPADTTGGGR
jgi:membrane fusion protein, multidrug efflux system